jgi:hypothetical protein
MTAPLVTSPNEKITKLLVASSDDKMTAPLVTSPNEKITKLLVASPDEKMTATSRKSRSKDDHTASQYFK